MAYFCVISYVQISMGFTLMHTKPLSYMTHYDITMGNNIARDARLWHQTE